MSAQVTSVTGPGVPLLMDDIDTDRIIPARFLRCVTFDGIGVHAFEDDRQQDPTHPFNQPEYRNGRILIAGRNFGCGSSREHAPQSLMRWGIAAIVAESFAEIFAGNCVSLGIPAVTAARGDLEKINAAIKAQPATEISLDLQEMTLSLAGQSYPVAMPPSARDSLTTGRWDFLAQLLENVTAIEQTAGRLPYVKSFAG